MKPLNAPKSLALIQSRLATPPQERETDFVTLDRRNATELLSHSKFSRNIMAKRVQQYGEIMERGRWLDVADPIKVDTLGFMIDGQHKLTTIVRYDTIYPYLIAWGLVPEALAVCDLGAKRTLAQHFTLLGEPYPSALSGSTRFIWQVENGGLPSKWVIEPTFEEFSEFVDVNPDIRDSMNVGRELARSLSAPCSPLAAAHWACAQSDPQAADDFFHDVGDMAIIPPVGTAVWGLRIVMNGWKSRGSLSRIEQGRLYDVAVRGFENHVGQRHTKTPLRLAPASKVKTYRQP